MASHGLGSRRVENALSQAHKYEERNCRLAGFPDLFGGAGLGTVETILVPLAWNRMSWHELGDLPVRRGDPETFRGILQLVPTG